MAAAMKATVYPVSDNPGSDDPRPGELGPGEPGPGKTRPGEPCSGETGPGDGSGRMPTRAETIARLRRKIAAVPARVERRDDAGPGETAGSPGEQPEQARQAQDAAARRLPDAAAGNRGGARPLVGLEGLAGALPSGGIERGSVTAVTGARTLLTGLLAEVTRTGGYAAVVGQRGLGLLAAVEMGADLSRTALVPEPGTDPIGIAAVLLDGMDLVVLDLAGARVPPSRSRAVMARARSRGSALVVTGGEWEGAHVRIDARVGAYEGLGAGCGRVRGMRLDVRARGRTFPARGASVLLRNQHGCMRFEPGQGSDVQSAETRPALAGERRRGA